MTGQRAALLAWWVAWAQTFLDAGHPDEAERVLRAGVVATQAVSA